jgi:hypothetical protein
VIETCADVLDRTAQHCRVDGMRDVRVRTLDRRFDRGHILAQLFGREDAGSLRAIVHFGLPASRR